MAQVEEVQDPNFGKFKIDEQALVDISSAGQERTFAQEVDILMERGGISYLEQNLDTNFKTGLKCDQRIPPPNETEEERKHLADAPGEPIDKIERIRVFSTNEKARVPPKSFCLLLFEALNDFTLKILIVAAVISIIISVATADADHRSTAWIEGFAILMAVAVCSLVTAINDYQKEKQFQVLNSVADARKIVTVIRNGIETNIHQEKLLVGDIVKLAEGMEIPADGIVLQGADLTTDESAMTGETDPVKKSDLQTCYSEAQKLINEGNKNTAGKHDVQSPLIMSGTKILTGEGLMVVILVGNRSCLGKITELLAGNEDEKTPLQVKLEKIAEDIGQFGLYSSVVIVFVMLIRFAIERGSEGEYDGSEHTLEILDFFIIGITVVVVAIPEGLPLAVTLSLAFSVKKMLNDQNLVRKLQACETMGGANTICSDKTGTLTKNEMTLVQMWSEEIIAFDGTLQTYDLNNYGMNPEYIQNFYLQGAINGSAMLHPEEKGSKTETAILKFLTKCNQDYRKLRDDHPTERKYPFSSARKRMSIIMTVDGKRRLLIKGGSDMITVCCTKIQNRKGEVTNIDANMRERINQGIYDMASHALRTIGVAYKDLGPNDDLDSKDDLGVYNVEKTDLTLFCILGIADIVRDEVPGAVKKCFDAGIKVRMVTGDNKDTARAIAANCKILDPANKDDIVMEGPEFIKITGGLICKKCKTAQCDCPRNPADALITKKKIRVDTIKDGKAFDELYPKLCVMARSRPEDKYALVVGLIERGNVVAVTGDGTNDAPALKKADVGFAMGIAGTQYARDASDIILLDDNFNSIVKAVMWGRNIYDAIKKFLQFQLTVNVVAVTITLIGAAFIKQEVLTPIQMLWINLIMDTFASLALATEPPTEKLLERKPHNRKEYIVSKKMSKHIIVQSVLQTVIMILFIFAGEFFLPEYETQEFIDDMPQYIKDYTKGMSTRERLTDESLRYFTREPWKTQFNKEDKKFVCSGRLKSYSGLVKEYYHNEEVFEVSSRHFTYVFNVFVWMQIFNFVNCRKLKDEFNIFEGLTTNYLFPVMVGFIIVFQIFIVIVGRSTFNIYKYYGLTIEQWLICIGFGALSNFVSILIKFIPEEKIFTCALYENAEGDSKDQDDDEDEDQGPAQKQEEQVPLNSNNNKYQKQQEQQVKQSPPAKEQSKPIAVVPNSNSSQQKMESTKGIEENGETAGQPQQEQLQAKAENNNNNYENSDNGQPQEAPDEGLNQQQDVQQAHQEKD